MKSSDFTHLHVHTDASLRDGLGPVSSLIAKAKRMGFQQIAMTDHGTLANAITFGIEAKAAGIKPLFGLEGYVSFDGKIGHITLLADGQVGWNSLLQLNNIAHKSEFRQPAFTIDELVKHQKGLVCLSGCIASPLQQLSLSEAYSLGLKLKSAFGHRFFAEAMFVGDSLGWERPLRLANRLNLKTVITNDVHFPDYEQGAIHPVLTRMKSGFDYDSSQLYLKSAKHLLEMGKSHGIPEDQVMEMLRMTGAIANKLRPVELGAEPRLPSVGLSAWDFASQVSETTRGKKLLILPEYYDRFRYELDIIIDMGYSDYFIILNDIIKQARKLGAKVGPGRGSGAGSLILFLLGITDVDPIEHGLQFERFLNPERKGMPDVDVDIESERREQVLDYAAEKYGAIPISTYARYSHKSLTRDLGKMFRADKELIGRAADGGENSKAFSELAKKDPLFIKCYESFMGQIRHKGKHAGGVIITDTPVPVERISDGVAAAWSEGQKNELSHAGIVKFDLLGLSALSALRILEEGIGQFPESPTPGHPAFEIFQKGLLSGIFQFSGSDGIRQLTLKLQPDKFEDLVAINALFRPGAIDAGSTKLYPEWKESPREVPAFIEDILEETYGAVVYQEQVMAIFARTVGGSLGEADTARRIISKAKPSDPRWVAKFERLRAQFIGRAQSDHGMEISDAHNLWGELATHSRYSFNKSHSTAYAMISWQCAWWKYNYPAEFYAAMLNVDPQEEQTYIVDAVNYGIEIKPPHVNLSLDTWTAHEKTIYMPLGAVKFLGQSGVNCITSEREALGGKFEDVNEFMKVCPKKLVRARAREGLLRLGGFVGLYRHIHSIDELHKVLALKDSEPLRKKRDRQLKYLGFIVPDKKLLDDWAEFEEKGWVCGIIKSSEVRTSKWGPYRVYRLSPNGVFWSREVMDLEKGQVVAVNISEKNGKAKRINLL